jgi:uncharacterized GH25 family protein
VNRARLVVLIPVAATLLAGLAQAHDFWLVPVGDDVEARTGERFPTSTDAIDVSRLVEASAVSAGGRQPLAVIGARGKSLVLRADVLSSGTFYAVVTLAPRQISLSAEQFNDYLREDGLPQIYAQRRARGELGRPAVERYQKFAKALLQHSGWGSTATYIMGQRLEIIPRSDPSRLHVGDTLQVQVRFDGHAIRGLTVNGGWEGQPTRHAFTAVTDSAGHVTVRLSHAGLWYLRTINMRRVADGAVQYESFWASVTFRLR